MYLSRQPGNPAGTYETVHYYSTTAGTTRQACVMLPTEYDTSKDYPVVYLLHGLGGNDEAWKDMGADCIAENLHIYQNVPQMILVGVDSVILSEGSASDLDMWGQLAAYDASVDDIVNDLMPYINTHYPVRTGREILRLPDIPWAAEMLCMPDFHTLNCSVMSAHFLRLPVLCVPWKVRWVP